MTPQASVNRELVRKKVALLETFVKNYSFGQ